MLTRLHRTVSTFARLLGTVIGLAFFGWWPTMAGPTNQLLYLHSINVNTVDLKLPQKGEVSLGTHPEDIGFYFTHDPQPDGSPIRIRTRLEGYDKDWQEGAGEMHLAIQFFNNNGDLISQKFFNVTGTSPGWTGSLRTSSLTPRRENLSAPSQPARLIVIVSSAGPPATLGLYAVANLIVSKSQAGAAQSVILQSPFVGQTPYLGPEQVPAGWQHDGNRPSMARVFNLGRESSTLALGILDDSTNSHAEWHNSLNSAPRVEPGDDLEIEWNEMYTIGVGDTRVAQYKSLPPGHYQFHAQAVDLLGRVTGDELVVAVRVPPPFWKSYWFWGCVLALAGGCALAIGRYLLLRQVRWQMVRLEMQNLLERERMRISRDIHDDLGARVTQISMVSAMASNSAHDAEKSRQNFNQITEMSRDLVAALYETVWAVNPENDNLSELGTYLFQMVHKQCERSSCRCRFHLEDLPREVVVPSQIRHNICMAVKEAVNNIKKHAGASELTVKMDYTDHILAIAIEDDGCGFEIGGVAPGNGLNNLQRRLKEIGGICRIESRPGRGTLIHMRIEIKPVTAG